MTNEEWQRENDKYLHKFSTETMGDESDITGSVKATICQFLCNVKRQFNLIALESEDMSLTREDIIQSQIDQLRVCIIDLQNALNTKEGKQ